jgi:hypothetical protein
VQNCCRACLNKGLHVTLEQLKENKYISKKKNRISKKTQDAGMSEMSKMYYNKNKNKEKTCLECSLHTCTVPYNQ